MSDKPDAPPPESPKPPAAEAGYDQERVAGSAPVPAGGTGVAGGAAAETAASQTLRHPAERTAEYGRDDD